MTKCARCKKEIKKYDPMFYWTKYHVPLCGKCVEEIKDGENDTLPN